MQFTQTSETLDDDSTILSQIEQIIMSSSMSIPEVDSLLEIGGDDKPSLLDPNEEIAIGAIQQQLMSIESSSIAAGSRPGSSPLCLDLPFAGVSDRGTIGGNALRLPSRRGSTAVASGSKATTISDLMKEFRMLESQGNAALSLPAEPAQQPKPATQSRHVVNQLQKILSSRSQGTVENRFVI